MDEALPDSGSHNGRLNRISRAICCFGRYPHKRPEGLIVDDDGAFTVENLFDAWGCENGYDEDTLMEAIQANMYHDDDGELRFSVQNDEEGRVTVRVQPSRKGGWGRSNRSRKKKDWEWDARNGQWKDQTTYPERQAPERPRNAREKRDQRGQGRQIRGSVQLALWGSTDTRLDDDAGELPPPRPKARPRRPSSNSPARKRLTKDQMLGMALDEIPVSLSDRDARASFETRRSPERFDIASDAETDGGQSGDDSHPARPRVRPIPGRKPGVPESAMSPNRVEWSVSPRSQEPSPRTGMEVDEDDDDEQRYQGFQQERAQLFSRPQKARPRATASSSSAAPPRPSMSARKAATLQARPKPVGKPPKLSTQSSTGHTWEVEDDEGADDNVGEAIPESQLTEDAKKRAREHEEEKRKIFSGLHEPPSTNAAWLQRQQAAAAERAKRHREKLAAEEAEAAARRGTSEMELEGASGAPVEAMDDEKRARVQRGLQQMGLAPGSRTTRQGVGGTRFGEGQKAFNSGRNWGEQTQGGADKAMDWIRWLLEYGHRQIGLALDDQKAATLEVVATALPRIHGEFNCEKLKMFIEELDLEGQFELLPNERIRVAPSPALVQQQRQRRRQQLQQQEEAQAQSSGQPSSLTHLQIQPTPLHNESRVLTQREERDQQLQQREMQLQEELFRKQEQKRQQASASSSTGHGSQGVTGAQAPAVSSGSGKPLPPPGDNWTLCQDGDLYWYYYEGPLGKWWNVEGSDDIQPYDG